MSHTPGPLIVRIIAGEEDDYNVERVDGELRSVLAQVKEWELCEEHGGTAKGNAILFAAAPELLIACEEALRFANRNDVPGALHPGAGALAIQLRAAIARATGKGEGT